MRGFLDVLLLIKVMDASSGRITPESLHPRLNPHPPTSPHTRCSDTVYFTFVDEVSAVFIDYLNLACINWRNQQWICF